MNDDAIKEVEAMFKTFEWTIGMITQSGPEERRHMADAYQALVGPNVRFWPICERVLQQEFSNDFSERPIH
ncbi:hypothetical protein [Agrobacterium rosae]|uniref:Uncharacterized protein n=1 Tax=Agrobacterium rosae TaxID=1972867 RepID=A0A1R3U1W4_9HYPH|nr:hypothetical protein [Agrobacterium rosae]SCX35195.1 hypothetical protein DSM25559_4847 [Agrobacterium rosae]